MLLIARREAESIIINGSIKIKIIEIKGNRVKLGFEYPTGNTVYREEIFKKIQEENRSAMQQIDPKKLEHALKKLTPKNQHPNTEDTSN